MVTTRYDYRVLVEVNIPMPAKGMGGYGVATPKDLKLFAKWLKKIEKDGGDMQMVVDTLCPIPSEGVSIGFGHGLDAIGDKGFWMSVNKDTLEAMIKALQLARDNFPEG